MAQAYILELGTVMNTANGVVQIADLTSVIVDQTPVPIGVAAATSAKFSKGTNYIRVEVDATCSFKYNGLPVANTNSRMYQNTEAYFKVFPGDTISFVAST